MKSLNFLSILFLCIFNIIPYIFGMTNSPNIIVILSDDQDVTLGGLTPLRKIHSMISKEGVEFSNMFVTTPLCCPSRASILTGKYAHNHNVRNNSVSGNCNSLAWQRNQENKAFITHFKQAGYSTFYAGKYLNQYGDKDTGGAKHIPPGWDHWFALVGNSRYYNYSISSNGRIIKYGSNPNKDYLTNVITKRALHFLKSQNGTTPFFMFLSPPAPHAPFVPFTRYKNYFSNFSAPRTPNFNIPGGKAKHWLLRQPPHPLSESVIDSIDDVFRNRWRTLLSVDDSVNEIYLKLKEHRLLKNTYIIYTSDNGFHLGQFSMPWDKRQLYEFDVRVPLLVRGPGTGKGIKFKNPVLNIDLAPTFLELANISIPNDMDGKSFASFLRTSNAESTDRSFIIEHQGEATNAPIPGCPQYQPGEVHTCEINCICEDSWNNTYVCVRELSKSKDVIACIFQDEMKFGEAYNITDDPFQLKNVYYPVMKSSVLSSLQYIKKKNSIN